MGDPFGRSPLPWSSSWPSFSTRHVLGWERQWVTSGTCLHGCLHESPSFHFFFFCLSLFSFLVLSVHRQLGCTPRCRVVYGGGGGGRRNRDKAHTIFHGLSRRGTSGFFGRRVAVAGMGGVAWCRATTWAVCRYVTSPWNKSATGKLFFDFASAYSNGIPETIVPDLREKTYFLFAPRFLLHHCISTFVDLLIIREKEIFVNNFLN